MKQSDRMIRASSSRCQAIIVASPTEQTIRVIDLGTNELAVLGMEVLNVVQYRNNVASGRSFWTEEFLSTTHRRDRVMEIGYAQASKDKVSAR